MTESKYAHNNVIDHFVKIKSLAQRNCPNCRCTHTIFYGKYSGRQRYLCKDCGKTFSTFTDTPLAWTHFPQKWADFIECTLKNMSLRASAKKLKMSHVTLFYWRHKLLAALKQIKPSVLKGAVELECFYIKYSEKGKKKTAYKNKRVHDKSMSYFSGSDRVSVLTAMDMFQNIFSEAVCRGFMNTDVIEQSIGKLLSKNNTLCSRPKPIFSTFLRRMKIKQSKKPIMNQKISIKYINGFMA